MNYTLPEKNHGMDAYELLEQGRSFAALGVYAYLESLIPGEEVPIEEMIGASPGEREEIYKALQELVHEGIIEEVAA